MLVVLEALPPDPGANGIVTSEVLVGDALKDAFRQPKDGKAAHCQPIVRY